MNNPPKIYDQTYFKHWYQAKYTGGNAYLNRKVALAVSCAEYYLQRPIRSVLDIGCGEGRWRAPLLALRPKISYIGFDSSEYAISKYGQQRNLYYAQFADFAHLRPCAPVDLLICADVLHYLPNKEVRHGLDGIAELCTGVAFLETLTKEDAESHDLEGDTIEFQPRTARWYAQQFRAVGLQAVGSHCWLSPAFAYQTSALERL